MEPGRSCGPEAPLPPSSFMSSWIYHQFPAHSPTPARITPFQTAKEKTLQDHAARPGKPPRRAKPQQHLPAHEPDVEEQVQEGQGDTEGYFPPQSHLITKTLWLCAFSVGELRNPNRASVS